ncbi:MAG: ABC transporter substrate-binding protein [Promethearchaeota archaeon]
MINLSKRTLVILLIAIIGIGSGVGIGVYFLFFNRESPSNEPPGAFTLSSDADNPDDDGTFTLTWDAADRAMNYSVYRFSSNITVINSSLTTLATSITNLSRSLSGYSNGTYYFIVVAHNAQGNTLSNCHRVIVAVPPENWITPGVIGISEEKWIKIGLMGDKGKLEGDQNYMGGYLAAKKINQEGGVVVNGSTYYIAIASGDTDEQAEDFSAAAGVAAAVKMINESGVQFAIGGFKYEALVAYRDPFMDNHIPFLSTGSMNDYLCVDVGNDYPHYKYYWRVTPYNSSYSSITFVSNTLGMYQTLQATYGSDDINHIGILAENLPWTQGIRMGIPGIIDSTFGPGTVPSGGIIAFDPEVSPIVMNAHLQQLEDVGCDVVLIAISLGAGLTMTQQWAQAERPFLLFGSNIQAQTAGYWDKTNGACEYEIGSTTATRCNKTPHTIEFYDMFFTEFNEHPIYIGFGAYDAVNLIVDSIEKTQSFDPDDFVADMETYTPSNPKHGGAGGDPVAWNSNHDLIAGYPFSYGVWFQWYNGTKTLIPSFAYNNPEYPSTLAPMGTMKIPDWFGWDLVP